MIENNQAIALWKRCLNFIKDNVNATAYKTWFEPVVPLNAIIVSNQREAIVITYIFQ